MTEKHEATNQRPACGTKGSLCFIVSIFFEAIVLLVRTLGAYVEFLYRTVFPTEKSVQGEIVLITGTGHGIGRELALEYCSQGAIVIGVDISELGNNETKQILTEKGYEASFHTFTCDVTQRQHVQELSEKIKTQIGSVSIIVNNAGIMPCHPLIDTTEEEIRKIFDVNVFSHFWILQTFLPAMLKANKGHVVGISSMAGFVGIPYLVPYCASKFAVDGLLQSLSEELRINPATSNVKLTTIFPFMVDTGLCKRPKVKFTSSLSLLTPQEVASSIVKAQRQGRARVTIPSRNLLIHKILQFTPPKVRNLIADFVESGVEPDLI